MLVREDGVKKTVRIVGEDEAEVSDREASLSWAAPFAQTLFGLKAGQALYWETEAGAEKWSIVSISYDA